MKKERVFKKKWIYIVSLVFAILSFVMYVGGLFVRINAGNYNWLGLMILTMLAVLVFFQSYFLIIKSFKSILLINVHLIFLFCYTLYELANELFHFGIYNQSVNGLLTMIIIIAFSLIIVNKYKVQNPLKYENIEEIGGN